MSNFLTRRGSTCHFVRRVPAPLAALDPRGIIRLSTHVRVAEDRSGRHAARIAHRLNEELEAFWHRLAHDGSAASTSAYEAARRRARSLGFDYLESAQLLALPLERCLERLEALASKGVANDAGARAAVLGTEKRPAFLLSILFEEYEAATKDEVKDLSRDQLRNGRIRAVAQFVKVVGDKPVTEITENDGIDYAESTSWSMACVPPRSIPSIRCAKLQGSADRRGSPGQPDRQPHGPQGLRAQIRQRPVAGTEAQVFSRLLKKSLAGLSWR